MRKPKPKSLYTMTPAEVAYLHHSLRQLECAKRAVDHFLGEITARERVPTGANLDLTTGIFTERVEQGE